MALAIPAVATMPIFTASTRTSSNTASICAATKSGSIARKPRTPWVFCAVNAVSAAIPYVPNAAKVFRSAWMPAPPLGSDPAMLRML